MNSLNIIISNFGFKIVFIQAPYSLRKRQTLYIIAYPEFLNQSSKHTVLSTKFWII